MIDLTKLVTPLQFTPREGGFTASHPAGTIHVTSGELASYYGGLEYTVGDHAASAKAAAQADYAARIIAALDQDAIAAMLREAVNAALRQAADAAEAARVAILMRQEPDANPLKVQMTRQAARKPILAMIDKEPQT